MFFSDHIWNDEDQLIGCSKGGDLFVIEIFDVIQTLPFDNHRTYSCLRSYNAGFCAATEEGMLYFYRQSVTDKKCFDFVRKWTCSDLRNQRILSMACMEIGKEDVWLGVATKNQNIVYLNLAKQIYNSDSNDQYTGAQ